MLPDGRRLGAHLPLAPGMVKAIDRAHLIGASAIQVFADNPTAWRRRASRRPSSRRSGSGRGADIRPVAIHAVVPRQPRRARTDDLRALGRRARRRAATRPRRSGRASSTSTSGRIAASGVEVGVARLVDGIAQVLGALGRSCGGDDARPRELGGRRRGPRHEPRRARRRSPTASTGAASTADASGSASTSPMPGAPASTSATRRSIDAFLAGFDGASASIAW